MLSTSLPSLLSTFIRVPGLRFNRLRSVAGMVIRPLVVKRLGFNHFLHRIPSTLIQFHFRSGLVSGKP